VDGPNIEIVGLLRLQAIGLRLQAIGLRLQAIGLRLQVVVVLPAANLCFEYWTKGVHEKYPTSSSQTVPDEDF